MSFNLDVGVVINDYHRHLSVGYSSKSSMIVVGMFGDIGMQMNRGWVLDMHSDSLDI